ncbi:MAG: M64 family metallopeptidase, partial [Planctomycetota bacterium]
MLRTSPDRARATESSRATRRRRAALGTFLVLGGAAVAAHQTRNGLSEAGEPVGYQVVFYDGEGPNGALTGGAVLQPAGPDPVTLDVRPASVTTLFDGGAPLSARTARGTVDNRLDLVFVGDGYTASELGTYQAHVDNVVAGLFGTEPLGRYSELFAVHRVDVVSNESGVDNDPVQGIDRDTALNMSFWCNGIERLLCVSPGLAFQFALNAPGVDQIVALANTTKYGGAGYPSSSLATSSGANGSALEIVKHELGHSLGKLADEYTYGGPTTYTGGEPTGRNVSTYDAAPMASLGAKWADWLGASEPGFEGTVGTFEGAQYSVNGIYRPTNNSLMRNLGRPFNLVGAEQVIKQLYREVNPVDASSDPSASYGDADVLFVDAIVVGGAPLPVTWELDGAFVATGAT